jgi:hypothetical protein
MCHNLPTLTATKTMKSHQRDENDHPSWAMTWSKELIGRASLDQTNKVVLLSEQQLTKLQQLMVDLADKGNRMAQSNEWYLDSKSCAGAQAQPAKLARMAASKLKSDAAIQFKLGRRATE